MDPDHMTEQRTLRMDLTYTAEQQAFRAEAQGWLEAQGCGFQACS